MRVETGCQAGATRRAKGALADTLFEEHAARGQAVNVGRAYGNIIARAAQPIPAVVIGDQEEEIGCLFIHWLSEVW